MNEPQTQTAERSPTAVAISNFAQVLTAPTMLQRIGKMLPSTDITPERFAAVAMNLVRNTPELVTECDRDSLMLALYDAAQSGLPPDGVLGQCYIIPFKKQAVFILGYRGMITLAQNSGQVLDIGANEVRARDAFDVIEGTETRLTHRADYAAGKQNRGPIVAFYAVAKLRGGGTVMEIMSKDEVDEIRTKAPGGNSPAWNNHYSEMGKKTVMRRLAKWLPQSVQRFTQLEEHLEARGEVVHLEPGSGYSEIEQPKVEGPKTTTTHGNADGTNQKPGPAPQQAEPEKPAGRRGAPKATAAAVAASPTPASPPPPAAAQERGQLAQGQEHRSPDGVTTEVTKDGEVLPPETKAVDLSPITIDRVPGSKTPDLGGWFDKATPRVQAVTTVGELQTLLTNNTKIIDAIETYDEEMGRDARQLFANRETELTKAPFD